MANSLIGGVFPSLGFGSYDFVYFIEARDVYFRGHLLHC